MKKYIILILSLISLQVCFSQADTLYIMIENPFFVKNYNSISVGFGINSKDKRFNLDYYQFRLTNYKGWDENGNDIFLDINQLRKEINIDTIKYFMKKSFSENKEWWQIHNELSLKKKIFLIEKREGAFNTSTGKYEITYYMLPMIYEGTRKNVVPTDLSN